ncbi:putative signal peptide-containing protein [Cryptosporidium parvum]
MELLRLHRFKKISVIFLFITVILLFLNFELLYASDAKESESNLTEVKNTQDSEDSSKKPESLDDGASSEAIGLLHSSDFDSFIQEKELNNKDDPEKSSEKHSTIKLMEEAPPALDLEEIPRLDNDINTNEKKEEQKSESENKDSDLHLKTISTPINQEQVSTSTSSSGSSSNSSSDSSAAVSSSASTLESAPDSFSSSVQTSTFNHASSSNQADEEIKLDHEESELKTLSQDSQESYSSTSQRGLRGYKEEIHPELSSVGPDSDSGSKPPAGSASASNLASTSNSGSGLLLPGTSEASSDEVELQLLLKSSTYNLPTVDSASEEEKNTTDTEAKTNTNSESSYSSQTDDETELKPQNSSQSEEEDGESKKLKSEMQAEESEFSSDFENNVEFPDDNSKASSSSAKSGSTTSSTGSNTKDEEIAITFEKPEIQEVSTQVENLTKPQETNTSYKYVSVATQTDPIKTSRRSGSSKRRARKIMTKKGLSLLIKEFNTSKTKKKITFLKKLFSRISNDDVNLISTLISREIANREKNHVLRRALSSNIPEKPLLGREWIQREKSKKQTS